MSNASISSRNKLRRETVVRAAVICALGTNVLLIGLWDSQFRDTGLKRIAAVNRIWSVLFVAGLAFYLSKSISQHLKSRRAAARERVQHAQHVHHHRGGDADAAQHAAAAPSQRVAVDWHTAPDVVKSTILQFLSPTDIGRCRCVNKRWRAAVDGALTTLQPSRCCADVIAARFPRLECIDLGGCSADVTPERLLTLASASRIHSVLLGQQFQSVAPDISNNCLYPLACYSSLQLLNVSQCVHIDDAGLDIIGRQLTTLTALHLNGCLKVTNDGLASLTTLTVLQDLQMAWCLLVQDAGLDHIAQLPSLSLLNISGCQCLTQDGLKRLANCTQLECLNFLHLGYVVPCVTNPVVHALSALTRLTSLSVGGMKPSSTHLTDAGLWLISRQFRRLKHLALMSLRITPEGASYLSSLTELTHLNLRGCSALTLPVMQQLRALPTLRVLNLLQGTLVGVSDEMLELLPAHREIEELGLGDANLVHMVTDKGFRSLGRLNKLRKLSCVNLNWHFSGMGLTPLLQLSNLNTLDFQSCQKVTDSTLRVVAACDRLTELHLEKCAAISDRGVCCITSLTRLQTLNLLWCHLITDAGLAGIAHLTQLVNLSIAGCNQVSDVGVAQLSALTCLRVLDVSACSLLGSCMLALARLSRLSMLYFNHCSRLSDAALVGVQPLTRVAKLDLNRCADITDFGVSQLSRLLFLTSIDFSFCRSITDAALHVLSRLPRLTTVKLNGCFNITDAGLSHLQRLTSLLTIHLEQCVKISDVGLHYVSCMPSLTSLQLANSKAVTDAGVLQLSRLTALCTLSLVDCAHVSEHSISVLTATLPGLTTLEFR